MQLPQTLEVKGQRVLTSKQISEMYETKEYQIKQNFSNNRNKYVEGKHYISFTGDELKAFKNQVENLYLVDKRTSHLYLWTEKGALLHAKSLNTDKAWETYDYLVDFYFRAKEQETHVVETIPNEDETEQESTKNSPLDIAPLFRELLTLLPIEALDEIEKVFRGSESKAVTLASLSILAEKMKRRMN